MANKIIEKMSIFLEIKVEFRGEKGYDGIDSTNIGEVYLKLDKTGFKRQGIYK